MKSIFKAALCATGSIAALATAAPAAAQDASDIIVTARRSEERLQDVPISITVFNQAQIDDRNVNNAADLATYTPSLSANTRFGSDNVNFSIRGFTQESRTTASVGIYFADVVAPRGGGASIATGDGGGPGSFFDLQNVQVLKGPQGTLQGRNTTGGAVLLVPKKPTSSLEGYVEGSIGNYDMRRVQAALNVPLGDNARFRIGMDRQVRDGYLKNISGIGPDDFANTDYIALRASLVVDLTPNLENYTIASFSRSDTNGSLPQMGGCNPASFPGGILCQQQMARLAGQGRFAVQSSIDNPRSLLRQWQIINTTTWRASDNLQIKNIVSYAELFNTVQADFFGTEWILPATLTNPNTGAVITTGAAAGRRGGFNTSFAPPGGSFANQSSFTEELQLQGTAFGDSLTWQAGAYMELSDPLGENASYAATRLSCTDRYSLQCVNLVPGVTGSLSVQPYEASYHDYGLYAQATYKLTERLSVTGGFRYTWDVSKSSSANAQYTFSTGVPIGLCANPLVRPRNRPITDVSQCRARYTQKSEAPTWLIGVDYKPVDDVLLYAKYARGYRQGSVNPLAAGGFNTFDPEKVDSYEVGVKASWRGAVPGNFNATGFYNNLTNQQLGLGLTSSPARGSAPPNNAIVNVGKSRLKGFEVEAGISPFEGLKLDASYAYIDSELLSTVAPTFPADSPYDGFFPIVAGLPAPFTPKNKYSLTSTYRLPLPESAGSLSVGATYSFVDDQYVSGTVFTNLPSYHTLNLNLNWKGVAGLPVDLSVFATNVTNEKFAVAINDMFASSGFVSYQYGPPRMYGLRLRYSFGQ